MGMIVSPKWVDRIHTLLNNGAKIDEILSFNKAKQYLITELTKRGIPFKVHSMGCGVSRITTDTTTCPCCHKTLG